MKIWGMVWKRRLWILSGVATLAILPLLLHSWLVPIEFNQFLIQKLRLRYGVISSSEFGDFLRSSYSSGLNILFNWPRRTVPAFDESKAMFEYVFGWTPNHAVVYPTEGFFYYKFQLADGHWVWGNIRVADLDKGELFFTYFTVPEMKTRSIILMEKDGIEIEKESPYLYHVSYEGKRVSFHVNEEGERDPKNFKMLAEEQFVGRIHDESGIKFLLLYNTKTHAFYDVLDEETGVAESFATLDDRHYLGKRSGFVFFEDPEYKRRILVGVDQHNIETNTYFDGPADQVPFRADLRERLYEAYPNTMLGDGIDLHGVLLNQEQWARVAIAPFMPFRRPQEILERNRKLHDIRDKSEFWTALTKEWWNNPQYRQWIAQKLVEEGKTPRIPEEFCPQGGLSFWSGLPAAEAKQE